MGPKTTTRGGCLIPSEVIDATTQRFEQARKDYDDPIQLPVEELLSQNSQKSIQHRLKTAGLDAKTAKSAARAVSRQAGVSQEMLQEATDLDALRIERLLGTNDLVDIRFLLKGAEKSAAVGRIRLQNGFATGFLVAPGVLMTNWHVFENSQQARNAQVEFGFRELTPDGRTSQPTIFRLDPQKLFFSDKDLDFSIVAVGNRSAGELELDLLPFCRLVKRSDAILTGERLNIIQHPAGEPKQVALRDNTVFLIPDETFIQYRSDTKRGSSGSPIFSDEWELVGLHHSGVPRADEDGNWLAVDGQIWEPSMGDHRIDWIANEGIQSAAIYRLLGQQDFRGTAARLVDLVLDPPASRTPEAFQSSPLTSLTRQSPSHVLRNGEPDAKPVTSSPSGSQMTVDSQGVARMTVPLEISIRLGDSIQMAPTTTVTAEDLLERFDIDDDYSNRNGYEVHFLETPLPLPALNEEQQSVAARNREAADDEDPFELPYHNFSLIMNGQRRIPFFTAVNIDGTNEFRISRDDEGGEHPWILDPRIGAHEQTNNDFYRGRQNRLDRGHLVRRLDPGWGTSWQDSARGIVDTFHYTNCSPQYDRFNRSGGADGLWLSLENYILDKAHANDMRVTVFSGPVFRDDDPDYRDNGLLIPREYWKIIAWTEQGRLNSAAFLLSQESLLDHDVNIERMPAEAFDFRNRQLYQTTIDNIETLTQLDFGPLSTHERFTESLDRYGAKSKIKSLNDIALA